MIWALLLLGVAGMIAWLFWPRRLQTLENVPAVVDEKFHAHGVLETTEDPREVRPLAQAAAKKVSDIPVKGQGDSLTRDWPNGTAEHHRPIQSAMQHPSQLDMNGTPSQGWGSTGTPSPGQDEPGAMGPGPARDEPIATRPVQDGRTAPPQH